MAFPAAGDDEAGESVRSVVYLVCTTTAAHPVGTTADL